MLSEAVLLLVLVIETQLNLQANLRSREPKSSYSPFHFHTPWIVLKESSRPTEGCMIVLEDCGVDDPILAVDSFPYSAQGIPQNQALRNAAAHVANATDGHRGIGARASSAEFSAYIEAQRQTFVDWAVQTGLMLDAERTKQWFARKRLPVRSSEHQVAHQKGRAFKLADIVANGTTGPYEYLTDLWLQNFAFGDDIRIEGVFVDGPNVKVVISQTWIVGDHPTLEELEGYLRQDDPDYTNVTGTFTLTAPVELNGVTVWDNKPANWIRRADESMAPIDLHFLFDDEAHRRSVMSKLFADYDDTVSNL